MVASLVAAGLDRPVPRKECHPGRVKSRAINSGCDLGAERRDIGYTRSGGAQVQKRTTISGMRGCSGNAVEELDSNPVIEIGVIKTTQKFQ
jgi:hypothetical protein